MQRIRKLWRNEWSFAIALTLVYIAVNAVLLYWHEPWRDEAQAWLISRDLGFVGMIRQAGIDGNPVLWWYLLAPLAKLGAPYRMIGLVSLAFMSAAVLLLLRYAPLSRWLRAAFAFSPCCVYWLPVISRNYALIPLALILIALSYKKRNTRPILYALALFFLSETHIIMEGLVGILMLFFWFEELSLLRRRQVRAAPAVTAMLLNVLSVAFVFFQFFGRFKSNIAYQPGFSGGVLTFCLKICRHLFYTLTGVFGVGASIENPYIFVIVAGFILLLICMWMRVSWKAALTFSVAILYQFSVYILLYGGGHQQRQLCMGHIFFFAVWLTTLDMRRAERKRICSFALADRRWRRFSVGASLILTLMFLLPLSGFLEDLISSHATLQSDAAAVAAYIREELPNDALIIGDDDAYVPPVAAYFDRDTVFYNTRRHSGEMFSSWSVESARELDFDAAIAELASKDDFSGRPWYLLSHWEETSESHIQNGATPLVESGRLVELARFAKSSQTNETYVLYYICQ